MNLNKVTLIGRIGKKPEIRIFPNGGKLATASIATKEKWRDRQTGETKSHTEWHELVFNGSQAETIEKYVEKGSLLFIEGSLRTRKWKDKDTGLERSKVEISVSNFQLGPNSQPQPQPQAQQQQQQQQQQPQAYADDGGNWEFDANGAPF